MLTEDPIFNIAILNIIIISVIMMAALFIPFKWKKRTAWLLWMLFFISLAIIVFFAEPYPSEDLYRHYNDIHLIREKKKLKESPLFVLRFIFWLVAASGQDGFLPAGNMILVGASSLAIMKKYAGKKYIGRELPVILIVLLGGCQLGAIVSGVRTAMVFAIWSYLYFFYYKSDNKIYWTGSLLCCLIHPVTLFAVGLLAISELLRSVKKVWKAVILLILGTWTYILSALAEILSNFNIPYVQLLTDKYSSYLDKNIFFSHPVRYLGPVGCVLLFLMILALKRKDDDLNGRIGFVQLCLYFTATASFHFTALIDRMIVLFGFLMIPFILSYLQKNKKIFGLTFAIVLVFGVLALFYFNALIAHETFHGVDFYEILRR